MQWMKPLCVTALLWPTTAWAQENDIIVTGVRQAEPALTFAGAVAVLDAETIETVSAVHPAELLNAVAGVHIHRGSGQEHLTSLRSPVLTGGAGAGSFLYLEDGVPLRAAGFGNVNGLFEAPSEFADRVEVLKGPGSVVYGSNAVHGLVNFISEPPRAGRNKVRLMVGEDGYVSGLARVSGENTQIDVSLAHDDGFRDASGFDQQKIRLSHQADTGLWRLNSVLSATNLNQETAGFIRGNEAYKDDAVRFTNPNPEAFRDGVSVRAHLKAERSLSEGRMLSVTPYARYVDLRFLRHFVPGQALEKNRHHSVGVLTALYGPNSIIGGDVEYTDGYLKEYQDNPRRFSYIQGAHYDYGVKAFTAAGYGQFDVAVTPKTELTVGARGEYTRYDYHNKINSGTFGRFQRVDDRSDDFFTLTPKVTLTHVLNDRASLYARAVRGARAPQVSDVYSLQRNQTPGDIKSETLDSLESGWRFRDGTTHLEITAFAMDKENFFFRNADGFNVSNGKTRHIGVEVSGKVAITETLSVSADGTYAAHTYRFDDTVRSASSSVTQGDDVDTAPRTLANIRADWQVLPRLNTGLAWRHVGGYKTDPGNTRDYPGHNVFVLRGAYDLPTGMRLFGRIDNVFDVKYADRADFAFGSERYFPGRPRTVFLGVSWSENKNGG